MRAVRGHMNLDEAGRGHGHCELGRSAHRTERQGQYMPLYELMLVTVPVGRIRGVALQNLAGSYATQGRFGEAAHYFEDAYAAFEAAEDRWGMAHVLNHRGCLALDRGELDQAEDTLQRATDLAREIQDLDLLAIARLNYAEALLARGDLPKAEIEVSGSLGHFVVAGNELRRAECLRVLGDIALRQEQTGPARRFYQSGLDICRRDRREGDQRAAGGPNRRAPAR